MVEELAVVVERLDFLSGQIAELTEAVNRLAIAQSSSAPPSSYEVVRPSASVALGPPTPQSRTGSASSSIYNDLATEVPPVPDFVLRSCSQLSGGKFTSRQRAERAWTCGWWARFCLEGRLARPRPSTAIDLANQCYIVLRAPGFQVPLLALRAGDYRHVVGDFTSDTISHGFPSQAEARAYCLGAGVEFPSRPSSWSSRP